MFKKLVNVFMKKPQEARKEMTVCKETATALTAECTRLTVQEKKLPQEKETADGIISTTEFIGEMDDYDRPVELPFMKKNVLDKEVRVITDDCGHQLFAWIEKNEEGRMKVIAIQHYREGGLSPKWEMKKSDILKSFMASESSAPVDKMMEKEIRKFLDKMSSEYIDIFDGEMDEIMKPIDIVRMLAKEMRHLPVYSDGITEIEREEFHKKIVEMVSTFTSQVCDGHRAYFPIDEEGMGYLASNFGIKKEQMIKRLLKYDLLHVTTSMKGGIKANVNFGNYYARRYCIRRDIGYDIEKDSEKDTTYNF